MSTLVVVTGGAGFVGSHLVRRLVADGHQVISLDNYFSGSRENHVPGAEYREGHTKDIETLIPESPAIVYHLGEYSRVAKSLEEPELVFDLNIIGTAHVVEFCRKKNVRLIYAGSSTKFVKARTDGTYGRDLSPYTWGKAINSELIANYGRWYGLDYAIAYFYNVYGPGERSIEDYGTVIETFRQNSLAQKPHQVRAPGTQTRAFTHVEDTVSAIILIAERGSADEYGISSQDVYSLIEVAQMFGGEIQMLPATQSTRSSGAEDTAKLEALGWRQKHTLKEYIESTRRV